MSWSIHGSIRRPVGVPELLRHTREVLSRLLALDEIPELSGDAPAVTIRTAGTDITFTVLLPTGDGAEVSTLELIDYSSGDNVETMSVVAASRYYAATTCVSVVLCSAIALAAAELGGGGYFDENLGLVRPETFDPREVIATTRLSPSDLPFAQRCERYLRQFEHLGGWPEPVTLAEKAKPPQR